VLGLVAWVTLYVVARVLGAQGLNPIENSGEKRYPSDECLLLDVGFVNSHNTRAIFTSAMAGGLLAGKQWVQIEQRNTTTSQ